MAWKKIPVDCDIIITTEREMSVCVHYRCYINDRQAFAPMDVTGSIHKERTLKQFIQENKKEYEQTYVRVEVVAVFVDNSIYEQKVA